MLQEYSSSAQETRRAGKHKLAVVSRMSRAKISRAKS